MIITMKNKGYYYYTHIEIGSESESIHCRTLRYMGSGREMGGS